jgi:hypothetical protein
VVIVAAMSFVEMAGAVGVVAAALIGVMTLFERITGAFGRWVRSQITRERAESDHYVRHHLGPNGDTSPLWRRVVRLEHHLGLGEHDAA